MVDKMRRRLEYLQERMKIYLNDHNIPPMKKDALDELNSHLEKLNKCIEKVKIDLNHSSSLNIRDYDKVVMDMINLQKRVEEVPIDDDDDHLSSINSNLN